MMPFYLKLFNLVFNTGIIPETWPVGNLKPKHMKKVYSYADLQIIVLLICCLGKDFV